MASSRTDGKGEIEIYKTKNTETIETIETISTNIINYPNNKSYLTTSKDFSLMASNMCAVSKGNHKLPIVVNLL